MDTPREETRPKPTERNLSPAREELWGLPFSKFLDSLEKRQQAKIIRIFQYVKEYGLDAITIHTKKLTGTPFWEIRIVGRDSTRIIYILPKAHTILVLHGFVKKKQKTPKKELEIASARYKDWLKRSG